MPTEQNTLLTRIGNGSRLFYGVYECRCGNKKEIYDYSVRKGVSRSCGCLRSGVTAERSRGNTWATKHGKHGTREYRIYQGMISRCTNPNGTGYANWGGRGIEVCARWLESFENFLTDMGKAPPKHQIERIDNDGDYCPENCKWATQKEQLRNKRNNRNITYRGKTQCLMAWAEELGVRYGVLCHRLNRGWSVEDAFTRPVLVRQKPQRNGESSNTAES